MTHEEAAELLLSGQGKVACLECGEDGGWVRDDGSIDICESCWGKGHLVTDDYIQARELLGMEPSAARSFTEMMVPEWNDT